MLLELLRDVARTDVVQRRSPLRLLLFPVSIGVHGLAAAAYFMIPLAAEVRLPPPPAPDSDRPWVVMAEPPPPPAPAAPRPDIKAPDHAAPTNAPTKIGVEPETPPDHRTAPGGTEGGAPAVTSGMSGTPIGTAVGVAPPAVLPPTPVPQHQLVKVGGAVRAPARIAGNPPVYPQIALSAHVTGTVMLEAIIDEHGVVDRVRVVKSVPLLDAAAIDAVRSWRYTPTLLNGVPVSVMMTVTVTFSAQR